jgi:signal transduction histidine kinase
MKDEFVNTVSHELRTPLTAVKECLGIVLDGSTGALNEEQKDFLDTAKKNVDRLARLINNVLDFQKLRARKIQFLLRDGDINELVMEVWKTMQPVAKNKGLELSVVLEPGLPKVAMDHDKITQVLMNLVGNAIKCTPAGEIKIITFQKYHNAVCVCVKDTGIGIQKADLDKLFKSFSQIFTDKRVTAGGTGLGLAISKEIVEGHRGKIWAESEFGKGSSFYFVLPLLERRIIHGPH